MQFSLILDYKRQIDTQIPVPVNSERSLEHLHFITVGVPLRMKAMVVAKYMITERRKEEKELMKNEMERFLNFYSTQVYKTLSDEVLAIDQQIESISTVGAYIKL